jgi:hypothetical protein
MRGHAPILIEEFNGLWRRGDADSTPPDHFSEATNVEYIESGFQTRQGIEPYYNPQEAGTYDIVRMYTFNTESDDGLITLDSSGNFYHVIPGAPSSTLILSVPGCDDFAMVYANDRAYISPYNIGGSSYFVYVYNGDGTPARKIAGDPPVDADGALAAANSATVGNVEAGIHIFGVVYETDSGFLTQIGPDTLATVTAPGNKKVDLSAIPISPNSYVVARHVVASKAIDPTLYTGDTRGYELFFVPDGYINDNTTTTLTVNFFDSELLDSAAYLLEIASEVPNGNNLAWYHNRMVVIGEPGDPYIMKFSQPGDYETFDEVDGILSVQKDGLGLTNGQEYRDVFYAFKINETWAATDNGDVPSSWPLIIIDEGLGAGLHGVMFVANRQGINVEFLMVHNYSGVYQFNGTFAKPEMTYKIMDLWLGYTDIDHGQEVARKCQFYNDPIRQRFFINIPSENTVLFGDYANGMTPEKIRWATWTYNTEPTTITIFGRENNFLIGSIG